MVNIFQDISQFGGTWCELPILEKRKIKDLIEVKFNLLELNSVNSAP